MKTATLESLVEDTPVKIGERTADEMTKATKRAGATKNRERINEGKRKRYDPEKQRRWRDPIKSKLQQAKWRKANPEKMKVSRRKMYEKSKEKNKEYRMEIKDWYVADALRISVKILKKYPDLIESHREVIRLKRKFFVIKPTRKNEKSN
jgi:hypothetical protein